MVVSFNGNDTTVTSGTSYGGSSPVNSGANTISFTRSNLTPDVGTIQVARQNGGKFINAAGLGLTTPSAAMDVNLYNITGAYRYNIRNCTVGSNFITPHASNGNQNATTGVQNPNAICFIEFLDYYSGTAFQQPVLNPASP